MLVVLFLFAFPGFLCRFVTKLLEDLVFFVVDIPNSGQDVLEIMVNKPNRERQKLMREQNILKQVELLYNYTLMCFLHFYSASCGHAHTLPWWCMCGLLDSMRLPVLSSLLPCRSLSFCRLRSQTVGMGPCSDWRSLAIRDTHLLGTSVGCVTEYSAIPSRTTGRTRWVLLTISSV